MKKISFLLMAFGLMAASCTTSEFENVYGEDPHADFAKQFTQTFGQIAPNHDWGFGTAVRGASMRAANTWTDEHSCNWADKLNVVLPEGAVDITDPSLFNEYGNYQGPSNVTVWYVPEDFNGSLDLHNMNLSGSFYNFGTLTALNSVNYNGTVTFYNVGTMTYSVQSGNRHTVINTGTLTVTSFNNIGDVYNGGTLTFDNGYKADIPNAMSIYSDSKGLVYLPNGADFKAAADIHGTLVADADTKIQNSNTQYICGVKVDGVLDMTQGHLQSSNIEADEITFDGAEIWLTPGGHIKADVIRMPNSATAIYGEATSTGLIEVEDIYFQNTNNFDDSFSANIYFKVTGEIDFSNSTKFGGQGKHYANVEAYNDDNTTLKGYNSSDAASGSPACGEAWTVGTEPEALRIIAEDLGSATSDFDYNDVVFDAYIDAEGYAHITLQAAGGTLPLYVAGEEVHEKFGVNTNVMVNTNAAGGANKAPVSYTSTSKYASVKDIPVVVYKADGTQLTLKAENGKAAEKIAVGTDYKWTDERKAVYEKYPKFNDYVNNPGIQWYQE